MNINCIHCGHGFSLSDAYHDFTGPVKCNTCAGLLYIRTEQGAIRTLGLSLADIQPPAQPAPQAQPQTQTTAPAPQDNTGLSLADQPAQQDAERRAA